MNVCPPPGHFLLRFLYFGAFKHALTQFVVLCKYLPREASTVNTNFSCTLCTNYVPFYAFWATGKGHTSNIHQAPTGPDL
jgi:hypothetical protein